jgi:hypothetical protein
MVHNEFMKICKEIQFNERVYDGAYGARDPIIRVQDKIVSYFGNVYASGYCPSSIKDNSPAVDWNSTSNFSEDCRDRFLRERRSQGYHIFQVDPEKNLVYREDHIFSKSEFEAVRDRTKPLSPLFIEEYYPGIIKSLSDYNRSSGTMKSPGLIATRSNKSASSDSKTTTSKGTSSGSTSTIKKETDEEFRSRMNMLLGMAQALEREGDSYYKLGTMFYKNALDKYQEAQRIYATASVQKKIDQINSSVELSKAFNKGMDKVSDALDNTVHIIDPKRKTDKSFGYVNYNGILGTASQQNSYGLNTTPSDFLIGLTGQRLFFSLQLRFGIFNSGNIEYFVKRRIYNNGNSNEAVLQDKVLINETSAGLGFSAGLNIPINNFQIIGLYGYDVSGIPVKSNLISSVVSSPISCSFKS